MSGETGLCLADGKCSVSGMDVSTGDSDASRGHKGVYTAVWTMGTTEQYG